MTVPYLHNHPVQRPSFLEQVQWIGSDEDLSLQVSFRNQAGELTTKSFQTQGENPGEICLPSSKTISDLPEEAIIASMRMASLIASAVPGSKEWVNQFTDQVTPRMQTAIGDVVLVVPNNNESAVTLVSDSVFSVQVKKNGTNNPTRTLQTAYSDLDRTNYQYVPQSQLAVVPGSVKYAFPNHVHNYPSQVLSSSQKADIVTYLLAKPFWI
jgi:hypothetical protein